MCLCRNETAKFLLKIAINHESDTISRLELNRFFFETPEIANNANIGIRGFTT